MKGTIDPTPGGAGCHERQRRHSDDALRHWGHPARPLPPGSLTLRVAPRSIGLTVHIASTAASPCRSVSTVADAPATRAVRVLARENRGAMMAPHVL